MKHHRPRLLFLPAVLCLAVCLLAGCAARAATADPDADLPTIVIGSDSYPPFNYLSADGQPTGIDVELATEAFRRMGYKAQFVTIDWVDKKDLVENGTVDCLWGSFSIDGREDEYRWAGPYMVSRQVVAVMPGSDIETLADLAGKTVAVQATTKPEVLFLDGGDPRIPEIRALLSMQKRELIYTYLSKGYADAVAAHETSILQFMSDFGIEYRILDEPLQVVGLGVAFALNDDRGLDTALNAALADMRTDGTTRAILAKYLPDPDKYLEVDYGRKTSAPPQWVPAAVRAGRGAAARLHLFLLGQHRHRYSRGCAVHPRGLHQGTVCRLQ